MRYLGGDDVKTDVALERQSQHPLDTQYLAGDGVKTGVAAVRKTNVTLVDLDVVNPYFRSGNSLDFLQKHDIRFLGPSHSSSNLDTPSLQPGIDAAIQDATYANRVVIDVGGDPDGARALARFVPRIHALAATGAKIVVVYVFNACRAMAIEQPENLDLLRGIEAVSGLKINALLNNTHLKEQTTEKILRDADEKAKCLVSATGIPLVATTVPAFLHASFKDNWPVDILVGTPWEFNLH
jgi:hypothetical protein